jgi:hypothetical protein
MYNFNLLKQRTKECCTKYVHLSNLKVQIKKTSFLTVHYGSVLENKPQFQTNRTEECYTKKLLPLFTVSFIKHEYVKEVWPVS